MQRDDAIRIRHMIEAAETTQKFIAGRQRGDLDSDQMLLFALIRAVEVIGEAASKISLETRSSVPTVPWSIIISMRNRLIHAYFDVDPDILWVTVSEEIPQLMPLLKAAVPAE